MLLWFLNQLRWLGTNSTGTCSFHQQLIDFAVVRHTPSAEQKSYILLKQSKAEANDGKWYFSNFFEDDKNITPFSVPFFWGAKAMNTQCQKGEIKRRIQKDFGMSTIFEANTMRVKQKGENKLYIYIYIFYNIYIYLFIL